METSKILLRENDFYILDTLLGSETTPSELSIDLGISLKNILDLAKRLERLNLITRRKEWRVVTYSITSNGMKLLPHLSKMVYGD